MALITNLRQAVRKYLPKHPKEILVADDDVTHFSIAHPKTLPWFSSPVADGEHAGHGHGAHGPHAAPSETQLGLESPESNSLDGKEGTRVHTHHLRAADGEPELKRAHESSVIQLFYDLFFVANLTTFTSVHEINDPATLKSYVGFFGILWFTWLQVALFDIRFGVDSVFERLCKGLQFGVMTGFAVVGPAYQIGWDDDNTKAAQALVSFQTLSIILMVSRLIICAQYAVVIFWLRKYKKTWAPLGLHVLVLFVAAMIFFGLYFSFGKESGDSSLIAWYVIVGLEACVILLISAKYKFLSFRRTCIVERLGLLTLIILGEGVIGLCGSIQRVGSDQQFGPDIIGMIICGVVIIYAQWMLYFDQTESERVGTLRQLIWTILHFPYHVSILLLVEGVSQLAVWRKLIDYWVILYNRLNTLDMPTSADTVDEVVQNLTEVMNEYFNTFSEGLAQLKYTPPDLSQNYTILANAFKDSFDAANRTTVNYTFTILDQISDIYGAGAVFAAESFGVEPPENLAEEADTSEEYLAALIQNTFSTVFIYMFVCAGLSLIFTSIMFFFGKRNKVRGDFLNIFFRVLMGLGLTLVANMAMSSDPNFQNAYQVYAFSPWILPTVTLVFAVVVVVDNMLINYVRHLVTSTGQRGNYAHANNV